MGMLCVEVKRCNVETLWHVVICDAYETIAHRGVVLSYLSLGVGTRVREERGIRGILPCICG